MEKEGGKDIHDENELCGLIRARAVRPDNLRMREAVLNFRFRVSGLRFEVLVRGSGVQRLGFRVWGSGFWA